MKLYRLVKEPYHHDLTGKGAREYGGRWNRKGIPVLYTSEHISLSVLEILAQSSFRSIPEKFKLLIINISAKGTWEQFRPADLPSNWRVSPAPQALADFGTQWLESRRSLLLRVPSVLVPQEHNILVNPGHSQFQDVEIEAIQDFSIDPRLQSHI